MSRDCEDCGGEVEPGWLVCEPCRERREERRSAWEVVRTFANELAEKFEARADELTTPAEDPDNNPSAADHARAATLREVAEIVRKTVADDD